MVTTPLERWFPRLATTGYRITSPRTFQYNCVAWAVADTARWWEPGRGLQHYYWPPELPRDHTLATYIQIFTASGYVPCANADLVPGLEKLAIFVDSDGDPAHVARQLPSGAWTSKLGEWEDIEHPALTALEGEIYGTVTQILQRPRPDMDPPQQGA